MQSLFILLNHCVKVNDVVFARCYYFNVSLAILIRGINCFIIIIRVRDPAILSLLVPFPYALLTAELLVDCRFALGS